LRDEQKLSLFPGVILPPSWLSGKKKKNPLANAEDAGLISGSGGSPGGGNDNPFQYSCLKNSMAREAWWATVQGVAKSQT